LDISGAPVLVCLADIGGHAHDEFAAGENAVDPWVGFGIVILPFSVPLQPFCRKKHQAMFFQF